MTEICQPTPTLRRSGRKCIQKNWREQGFLNHEECKKLLKEEPQFVPESSTKLLLPDVSLSDRPCRLRSVLTPTERPVKRQKVIQHDKVARFVPFIRKTDGTSRRSRAVQAARQNIPLDTIPYERFNRRVLMLAIDCLICNKPVANRKALADHLANVHKKPPFKCRAVGCDQWFKRECMLGKHVFKDHADLKGQWPCPSCEGLYRTHNRLYGHILDLHTNGQFKCAYPDCTFGIKRTRNVILNHYDKEHRDGFQFKCSFCEKSFTRPSALEPHIRAHTGVKPFHCKWPDCGHSTNVRGHLKKHIRSIHFKIARELKKQIEQHGQLDERDPNDWIEVVDTRGTETPISSIKRKRKKPVIDCESENESEFEEMSEDEDEEEEEDEEVDNRMDQSEAESDDPEMPEVSGESSFNENDNSDDPIVETVTFPAGFDPDDPLFSIDSDEGVEENQQTSETADFSNGSFC